MTLYNYIKRRLHNDVAFAEFDRNLNFVPMIFYLMLLYTQDVMETMVLVE